MSNFVREIIRRGGLGFLLLSSTALGVNFTAQAQQPAYPGGGSGQHQWQGHPGGGPSHGMPPQGTAPQGMPAQGAPVQGAAQPTVGMPAVGAVHPLPPSTAIPGKKTPAGEQFFIVASVDLQKSQLLLKYPTEVTLLMRVDPSTKFVDDSGNALKLSDFRAGDTVWVTSANSKGDVTALHVRKGTMDVAQLHRYYLDYSEIK